MTQPRDSDKKGETHMSQSDNESMTNTEQSDSAKTLAHIDLCHAYCWVVRQPDGKVIVTFDERQGDDLALHRRGGPYAEEGEKDCPRCSALSRGASPDHSTIDIPHYPDDPKLAFATVLAAIGEHDERPR